MDIKSAFQANSSSTYRTFIKSVFVDDFLFKIFNDLFILKFYRTVDVITEEVFPTDLIKMNEQSAVAEFRRRYRPIKRDGRHRLSCIHSYTFKVSNGTKMTSLFHILTSCIVHVQLIKISSQSFQVSCCISHISSHFNRALHEISPIKGIN